MNWKHKSLILGSSAIVGLCPTVSLLTSCHNPTFDEVVQNINNSVISEFQWICTFYRNTFCNRNFCNELAKRIRQMGYTVVKDFDEKNDCPYRDDDPKHPGRHYHPKVESNFGYDLYFDIPANGKPDTYPTIALQAHTDMVCVFDDTKVSSYDWSKGVIPEYAVDEETGRKIMRSKNNITTLGADDGAGVASILAIAKHAKEFEHGRIRCIFTVDEEDGESGAKYLPKEWLNDVSYYLSMDGEKTHKNWCYSAGAQQASFTLEETGTPVIGSQEFTFVIDGLKGGHSGLGIQEHHLHPLLVMGDILAAMAEDAANYTNVRLVSCWDNKKPNDTPNGGSIPKAATFVVQATTSKTATDVQDLAQKLLIAAQEKPFQDGKDEEEHPACTVTSKTGEAVTGLTEQTTKQLAAFLQDYVDSKLYFHINESQEPKAYAKIGSNIGGVRVGDTAVVPGGKKLYIEFFGRSTDWAELQKFWTEDASKVCTGGYYYDAVKKHFGESATAGLSRIAYNDPWDGRTTPEKENKMQTLIHKAAKYYDNELIDEPVFGWLELSEVYTKDDSIYYGIIGPEIIDLHKPQERIYLDSIDLMNKQIIYIMQHLEEEEE